MAERRRKSGLGEEAAEEPQPAGRRKAVSRKKIECAADLWVGALEERRNKAGGLDAYTSEEAERAVIGLPLPYLSQRVIFLNDHLPLGRMLHLKGRPESMKSTLSFEILRWHLEVAGGGGNYILTEDRDQPDLRNSVIGWGRTGSVWPVKADHVEAWQWLLSDVPKRLLKRCGSPGACKFPICSIVDSVSGVTNEKTFNDVITKGYASVGYGVDANLIKIYLQAMMSRFSVWPMTVVFTNHLKKKTDSFGNTTWDTPGGAALHFFATWELVLKRLKDYDSVEEGGGGRRIEIKVDKNSMGDGHHELQVDVRWRNDPDTGLQHTRWCWPEASIEYLYELKESWQKKVHEVVDLEYDFEGKRRCVSSSVLGLEKASLQEAGEALEQNAEVREGLNRLFGVIRRRPFLEGVPYRKQLEDSLKRPWPPEALAPGEIVPRQATGEEGDGTAQEEVHL